MRLLVVGTLLAVTLGNWLANAQDVNSLANPFSVVAEACMAFVVGLLFARSYVMWKRCKALPLSGEAAPEFQR